MRLDLLHPLGPDLFETVDAVGQRALLERVETLDLRLRDGHHELARALDHDVVLRAESLEVGLALPAQARLERPRGVVQPGVDHAAVVARLVPGQAGLLLEDDHREPGPPSQEPVRGGQPQDAPAHDGHVRARGAGSRR